MLYISLTTLPYSGGIMTKGQMIGYKRVSSVGQNTVRQLDGLTFDEIFEDKISGKDTNRPALQAMLKHVRKHDTILIHSMDRLARNVSDLRTLVKELTGRGVKVQFIKENLVFTGEDSPMSDLLLNLLGAVAEFERAIIGERQKEGVQIAKSLGKYKGRPQSMTPERIAEIKRRVESNEKKSAIARDLGISRETVYHYLRV
jgi:DNA invertase Pin-like site-specific DNA recombinase